MNTAHHPFHIRTNLRIVIVTALALLPLATMNDALACAACGCTLSKDWERRALA